MTRREALKAVGLLLGGAVSTSVTSALLSGCKIATATNAPLQTLTAAQAELVATVAELILPTTDTPGAREAGVDRFVDGMLTTVYSDDERNRFLAGLADLDTRAQQAAGSTFVKSTPEVQISILKELQAEAVRARESGAPDQPFFSMMKELTLVGYYTSEIGATQELRYVHTAGRYDGDVPLEEIGRAYA